MTLPTRSICKEIARENGLMWLFQIVKTRIICFRAALAKTKQ